VRNPTNSNLSRVLSEKCKMFIKKYLRSRFVSKCSKKKQVKLERENDMSVSGRKVGWPLTTPPHICGSRLGLVAACLTKRQQAWLRDSMSDHVAEGHQVSMFLKPQVVQQ
jgi:hypothetical protein